MRVWSKAELRPVTYVFVWVDASVLHDSTDHSLHDCAKSTVVFPPGSRFARNVRGVFISSQSYIYIQ